MATTNKTADAANGAVSKQEPAKSDAAAAQASDEADQRVAVLNISREMRDALAVDFQKALHGLEMGFDVLTKPSDIERDGQVFDVIDGLVIPDYIDKRTGEEAAKCVFMLEYPDGRVVHVMQSAARPRRLLAQAFENAMLLGSRLRMGPYKFVRKGVGNIQDANIMERQSGFVIRGR